MGFIEKRNGKYQPATATHSATSAARPSPASSTPSASSGTWTWGSSGAPGSTLGTRAWPWRRGSRSSSPRPGGCPQRPCRPTAGTSTSTSCPASGSYRIGRLPADEIENWLNDEVAAGIAPSSVYRHDRTLRRVLQVAVEKQKIPANPCDRVQPPHVPKRDMAFLSWNETVALAEAHPDRYRALIYLAVETGMRWSELIGLRRSRLDLRARKVRVGGL